MSYTGIDYHKRCSVACTLDGQGRLVKHARIDHKAPEAFAGLGTHTKTGRTSF